jgi:hypothetical protein
VADQPERGPVRRDDVVLSAEGGIGGRPHAQPEAALPSAKPAALTQYRTPHELRAHPTNVNQPEVFCEATRALTRDDSWIAGQTTPLPR